MLLSKNCLIVKLRKNVFSIFKKKKTETSVRLIFSQGFIKVKFNLFLFYMPGDMDLPLHFAPGHKLLIHSSRMVK